MKHWREILCVAAIIGLIVGSMKITMNDNDRFEELTQKAIDNGAAYHDPQTGELVWIKRAPVKISRQRIIQTPDGKMWLESEDGTREPYEHERVD